MKKFREILESLTEGARYQEVASHDEYKKMVKKHHPDAKEVNHAPTSDVTQHVVGPRETPVGHWDHKYKSGRVKVYESVNEEVQLDEAKLPAGHTERGHVKISKKEFDKHVAAHKAIHRYAVAGHGHAIHVYSDDTHTSTQHYSHPNHKLPSAWEHYNRETGERTYSKKKGA